MIQNLVTQDQLMALNTSLMQLCKVVKKETWSTNKSIVVSTDIYTYTVQEEGWYSIDFYAQITSITNTRHDFTLVIGSNIVDGNSLPQIASTYPYVSNHAIRKVEAGTTIKLHYWGGENITSNIGEFCITKIG